MKCSRKSSTLRAPPASSASRHVVDVLFTLQLLPPQTHLQIFNMDPFSADGELLNIQTHFHQGQYQEVIDSDTTGLSAANKLPAQVLALRAQIAQGHAEDVLAEVEGADEVELNAVEALAHLSAGNESKALKIAEKLAGSSADNATVQVVVGTVLQAAGKSEEALALLSQHQGSRMWIHWELEGSADSLKLRLLRWLSRSSSTRIARIWLLKRYRPQGDGHKIVCWSTWQNRGSD